MKCQKAPIYAIFLNSWWFNDVKNYITKCSIDKYRNTKTNTNTNTNTNTQIQLVMKCQKDPTYALSLIHISEPTRPY